jgi:hypothetical protein
MKNLLKLAGASLFMCLWFAISAPAQIVNGLKFTTSFGFYAGNTKFPAGTYTVSASNYGDTILMIESATGTHAGYIEYIQTDTEAGHASSDVTFKKYGTVDFLDRVWVAGQQFGMQLEQTKVEKKLAEGGAPQTHSVQGSPK